MDIGENMKMSKFIMQEERQYNSAILLKWSFLQLGDLFLDLPSPSCMSVYLHQAYHWKCSVGWRFEIEGCYGDKEKVEHNDRK